MKLSIETKIQSIGFEGGFPYEQDFNKPKVCNTHIHNKHNQTKGLDYTHLHTDWASIPYNFSFLNTKPRVWITHQLQTKGLSQQYKRPSNQRFVCRGSNFAPKCFIFTPNVVCRGSNFASKMAVSTTSNLAPNKVSSQSHTDWSSIQFVAEAIGG